MKKLIAVFLILIFAVFLSGCNKQIIDMTYNYNYVTIYSPGGDIIAQGKVQSWTDYEDGDQLQVKIDGVMYLTHANNVVLEAR